MSSWQSSAGTQVPLLHDQNQRAVRKLDDGSYESWVEPFPADLCDSEPSHMAMGCYGTIASGLRVGRKEDLCAVTMRNIGRSDVHVGSDYGEGQVGLLPADPVTGLPS